MILAPRDEIVARRDGRAIQQKKHFSQGIKKSPRSRQTKRTTRLVETVKTDGNPLFY
jgi:hypothetical protein